MYGNVMNNGAVDGIIGGGLILLIIPVIISIILSIIVFIANVKIYIKAGKPWWAALIPIYNIIVLMDIVNLDYKNLLFILIPFFGVIIFMIKLYIGLAKRFNKQIGFAIGLILLPVIFLPILAFSKDEIQNDTLTSTNNAVDNEPMIDNAINGMKLENMQAGNIVSEQGFMNNYNNIEILESLENNRNIEQNNIENVNNVANNGILENNMSSNFEELDINQISNENKEGEVINQIPTIQDNNSAIEKIETFNIENELNQNSNGNNTIENSEKFEESKVVLNSNLNNEILKNEVESLNMVSNSANVCKNCGAEMPKIVTICPICGTDNE